MLFRSEPLRVEIPVQKVTPAEAANLQAKEADAEAYKAARMERDASLEGLSLELQERAGQRWLVITGKSPAKAGFVDVLLELRWATGRMVRDVGVLLGNAEGKARAPLPSHLRVQAGDTASQLAQNHKEDSVALDQMLLALLRSNPDAFLDNNVNRLKAGAILTLPDAAQAREVDREEARQALQLQAEEFASYRAALAERLPAAPLSDNEQAASGKIQQGAAPKTAPALQFWNGHGGFSVDGSEYLIPIHRDGKGILQLPPVPWTNVIANENFGFLVSESGAGCEAQRVCGR